MEQIKKYLKSKKGMITVGILAVLIILCIVLLVSCPKNSNKAGEKDKNKTPGNTVENMEDSNMTVSDDTDGPTIEDGSTDFSDTTEEGDLDDPVNDDGQQGDGQQGSGLQGNGQQGDGNQDDDKKDDGADIEDPTPGEKWGALY